MSLTPARPMRDKWINLFILSVVYLLLPLRLEAADIVIVKSKNLLPYNQVVAGFKQNIKANFTEYDLQGDAEKANEIMGQIRRQQPALVFTVGALATVVAKKKINGIPIIFTMVLNPEKKGLNKNGLFGIKTIISVEDQFRAFKSAVPTIRSIGVIHSDMTQNVVAEAVRVSKLLGLELVSLAVKSEHGVPKAMRSLAPKIDALWLVPDGMVVTRDSLKYLLLFTLEHNIPFMTFSSNFVKAGALLSLSVSNSSCGRQAARIAQRIIKNGAGTAKLSIVYPEHPKLAINLNTARNLNLAIPPAVLESATYIYE